LIACSHITPSSPLSVEPKPAAVTRPDVSSDESLSDEDSSSSDEVEWEVEKILAKRQNKVRVMWTFPPFFFFFSPSHAQFIQGRTEYLVKWLNWPEESKSVQILFFLSFPFFS
jgi:hypothetical protein